MVPDDRPPPDPENALRQLLESGRNIKFGSGVSGKTGRMMYAVLAAWAVILTRLSDNLILDAILVAVGLLVSLLGAWWVRSTQKFAERNPAQAVLDGAQFIEYKRFEAEAKGLASLGSSPLIDDPTHPRLDQRDSGLPDA